MRYWIVSLLCLWACAQPENQIKIAATPVPHADLLEVIRPELKKQGIELKIIEVDDYNLPNRLLAEKEVDANFFQHEPYLDEQKKQFGYDFVILAKVHIEPLGVYSSKLTSLEELSNGAIVAIPNDPTNESRALDLLSDLGLITLKHQGTLLTILDIDQNPKKLKIKELDAPFLPRVLPDVEIAIIPANFALQAHLEAPLAVESSDSPYANVIVVRTSDVNKEALVALKKAMESKTMREHIRKHYRGQIIPSERQLCIN